MNIAAFSRSRTTNYAKSSKTLSMPACSFTSDWKQAANRKWSPSGGENAKFGLDTTNLVAASQILKDAGLTHCLKLVHFHVGSQVPDISTIKRAVREAARYYAKLARLGHELGYLDVGGGLG